MEEKWVMVTGSNRGIGEQILIRFLENGYQAYAHARSASDEFEEKLEAYRMKYNAEIRPIYFDLTDSEAMKREMQGLIRGKRRLDVLVNNAGVMHAGLFQLTDLQEIRRVFDVNLFSVMELTQWAMKLMVRRRSGSIVNLSSITGLDLGIGQCAYGVSKAAAAAFTKTLASEMANYGIRVNAVAPGIADTRMAKSPAVQSEVGQLEKKKGPFARMAAPEEIARAVYFLGSEESSFVTGQILRVDGGNRL